MAISFQKAIFNLLRYHKFEISSNETLYGTASFKIGVKQFYNIFAVGAGYHDKEMQWSWGYGVGTSFPVHESIDLNIDAISYHVNNGEWWTNHINSLNKLNISASKQVSDYIEVFGGFSWNVLIADVEDNEGVPVDNSVAPWSVYNKTHNRTNVKMYPGFTVGIRL